ncbi:hypothetical protein B7494_g8530 [Chlorociboria aeruginascens]|nr:hypothetical protein B7494_g8530 [Chlorociboria aeruginascens]
MAALSPAETAHQMANLGQNQGPKIVGVSIFLIVLASTSVILRFIARLARSMRPGWDDWLCIPAMVFTICMCVINLVSVHYGLGKHLLANDPANGYKILEAGWFLSLSYSLTHFFVKMAILFTYVRIFTLRIRWFKFAVWAAMFYVSAWAFGTFIMTVTECRPLNYFWESVNINRATPAVGKCTINTQAAEISTSILNTIGDFILLILPMTVIWGLNLNMAKKIGIMGIFCVGILACVASILRFVSTLTVVNNTSDTTWDAVPVYTWTPVEAAVGLLCACFPVIGPLFSMFKTKLTTMVTSQPYGSNTAGYAQTREKDTTDKRFWSKFDSGRSGSSGAGSQDIDMHPLNVKHGGIERTDEYTVSTAVIKADYSQCDALPLPTGCTQCSRMKHLCPGYRAQVDLIFRDESKNVVRKAKAKKAQRPASNSPGCLARTDGTSDDTLEIIQQKPPQLFPAASNLSPTIEERATGFFVSNYVIGVNGPTKGHLNIIEDLYKANKLDDSLVFSMRAVGLAGYSHTAKAPELMKYARQLYANALHFTNKALQSADAKKDSTLMAIMVLGIYETVTGQNQQSMTAWAEHVNGAAALIKLRGREQLGSMTGRRLFLQVVSSLLTCCIQRDRFLPRHILELIQEVHKFLSPEDPVWIVQQTVIEYTEFHASIRRGICSDPQTILTRALELDGKLMSIYNDPPSGWEYMTITTDTPSGFVFNGQFHVYYDLWMAQIWNAIRNVRALLNERIRDILLEGFSSNPPLFVGAEYTAQFQICIDNLYQMQADILASIPQHVGFVSSVDASKLFSARRPKDNAEAALWGCFGRQLGDELPGIATTEVRQFVINNLLYIGHTMGIQQANVLAAILQSRAEIKVCQNRKPRFKALDNGAYVNLNVNLKDPKVVKGV